MRWSSLAIGLIQTALLLACSDSASDLVLVDDDFDDRDEGVGARFDDGVLTGPPGCALELACPDCSGQLVMSSCVNGVNECPHFDCPPGATPGTGGDPTTGPPGATGTVASVGSGL